jgi:hypothetical protein
LIYSEKYINLLETAEAQIDAAKEAVLGNLWQAKIELTKARENLEAAEDLLIEVSKTAFERVINKK